MQSFKTALRQAALRYGQLKYQITMKNLINIRFLIFLWFTLLSNNILISQSKEKDIIKNYLDLSLEFNKLGMIDSSIFYYIKVIDIKTNTINKTRHDSTSIALLYSIVANLQDYLGLKENLISSLRSSYHFFSNTSDPKTSTEKENQIDILKYLLYNLLEQNLQVSELFDRYLMEFTSQVENFNHNRIKQEGYKYYINSINKIKVNGFTKLDKALFESERHSTFSKLIMNDKLKYLVQIDYLKHLKEYRDLSPIENQGVINTHLVTLLGNLSYYSLFEKDFVFSENCAKEAIGLNMNQWWIATNLIHSVYLQGRLNDAKDLFYRYREIKHDDGKTLGTLIKEDINELQVKNICDSTYIKFLNKIDEEISIEFNSNTVPIIPILCEENGFAETTCILDGKSYKWTHDETGEIKIGKIAMLNRKGIWTLQIIKKDKTESIQKVYVDSSIDLKYTELYLRQALFLPIPIYSKTNDKRENMPLIAFTKGSNEFISIDTVANQVLNNFKPIKQLNGKSIIITNKELCSNLLNSYYQQFTALDAGIFLIINIDASNSFGTLFIKAKDESEEFPITNPLPKYNQLLHLQEILPEIVEANKNSYEIARVILSNLFMAHPIGGW